jgi:hypothetical protein
MVLIGEMLVDNVKVVVSQASASFYPKVKNDKNMHKPIHSETF